MIYFIRVGDKAGIKVGQTINLTQRIDGYRYQYGADVEVLGVMDGGRRDEKRILERFAHRRISRSRVSEWLEPADDLMAFINTHCRAWDGTNDMPASKQEVVVILKADSRSAPANREWLQELSSFLCIPIPILIDQALMAYAKSKGFAKPKPMRLVKRRKAI